MPSQTYLKPIRNLASGNIWTPAELKHECSVYCRGDVHAHIGWATENVTEDDVREAVTRKPNREFVDMRFVTEHPRIGTIAEPSGKVVTHGVICWVRHTSPNEV